jgi:hypothetical protein
MAQTSIYDFEYFPTLMTERLILRELRPEDAEAVFESWSDPEVQKFNAPVMERVEEAVELIEALLQRTAEKRGLIWGITHRERDWVMGMCGYNSWDRYHRRADIGYDMTQAHWGMDTPPKRFAPCCVLDLMPCISTALKPRPSKTIMARSGCYNGLVLRSKAYAAATHGKMTELSTTGVSGGCCATNLQPDSCLFTR